MSEVSSAASWPAEDSGSWVYAFIVMLIASSVLIMMRLLSKPVFAAEFELCIFHMPTVILFLFNLHGRRSLLSRVAVFARRIREAF